MQASYLSSAWLYWPALCPVYPRPHHFDHIAHAGAVATVHGTSGRASGSLTVAFIGRAVVYPCRRRFWAHRATHALLLNLRWTVQFRSRTSAPMTESACRRHFSHRTTHGAKGRAHRVTVREHLFTSRCWLLDVPLSVSLRLASNCEPKGVRKTHFARYCCCFFVSGVGPYSICS
ncbi:hypothetical protein EXIGLDRAFT_272343 [Exidia glandulosa HHB12029]|uniref:Uncharacterized protein n=1 Tax=Exidia glandulosa HHB12029 TaxID=1314781 RepID=A0A165DM28_EXIGL|nr:hypothetical protein EXIGLDRAFT_272343 [Exidia glandulosa HHB12029]